MLTFVYSIRNGSNFGIWHKFISMFQHHLFKTLFLPSLNYLGTQRLIDHKLKISFFWFSTLFHWSIFLSLCQLHWLEILSTFNNYFSHKTDVWAYVRKKENERDLISLQEKQGRALPVCFAMSETFGALHAVTLLWCAVAGVSDKQPTID